MFLDNVQLEALPRGIRWRLLRRVRYQGASETFEIPEGFTTDLASVPASMIWLFRSYGGPTTRCALLHDFLCDLTRQPGAPLTRRDADGIFRRVLQEEGMSWLRRWLMWGAVRLNSRLSGADLREVLQFLGLIPAAIVFCFPAPFVFLWRLGFFLAERIFR